MPWGDCTGPWWAHGKQRCFGSRWLSLTKEEQRKILEAKKEAIEKRLKELQE